MVEQGAASTSDANSPELGQTSQVSLGHSLSKAALTADTRGGTQATLTADQLATNSEVPTTPSRSVIYQNDLQSHESTGLNEYNFIIAKRYKSETEKSRDM